MAAQVKPETTAVARTKPPLPADLQAKVDERKARNAVIAAIRGTQWGRDCSEQMVRAVADYADRNGIDAATELEILGGRLYKTASYYRRKGAELMTAGVIAEITHDHIENDPRLDAAHKQAAEMHAEAVKADDADDAAFWRQQARQVRREQHRRQMERIRFGAPEKAAAIVVTKITVRGMPRPVEGCNWCGNGVRQRDPVGDAEPAKTAETRSERRAWIKLVSGEAATRVPALAAFARAEGTGGEEVIDAALVAEAEQITAGHRAALPAPLTNTGTDGYEATTTRSGEAVRVVAAPATPTQNAVAAAYAAGPDPYGDLETVVEAEDAHGNELGLNDERPTPRRRTAQAEGR